MIDPVKFEELAKAAKEAEANRAARETDHAEARKVLEEAAREAATAAGVLRAYVEAESGIRLK